MCRLFGFRSAIPSRAHRSLVQAENALALQARSHPDGWGVAWFHAGDAYVVKSETGAADSHSFRRASEALTTHTMVVHVRRATVGESSPFNVHPFRHGRWVFAHNGTIFGFEEVRQRLVADMPAWLASHVLGTTDTETLFFWLLGRLDGAGIDALGTGDIPAAILSAALTDAHVVLRSHVSAVTDDLPVVNYLLTNGRVFAAQRFGRELYLASQKHSCRDLLTCPAPEKICMNPQRVGDRVNHLLVASERIGEEDRWEELPEATLLVLSEDFRLRQTPLPGGGHMAGDCPACRVAA